MWGAELNARGSYVSWGDSLQRSAAVREAASLSELRLGSLRGTEADDRPGAFDLTLLVLAVLAAVASTLLLVALVVSGFAWSLGGLLDATIRSVEVVWAAGLTAAMWTSVVVAGRLLWRPVRRDLIRLALLMFTPLPALLLIPGMTGYSRMDTMFFVISTELVQVGNMWFGSGGTFLLGLLPMVIAWVLAEQLPGVIASSSLRWGIRIAGLASTVFVSPYVISNRLGGGPRLWLPLRAWLLLVALVGLAAVLTRARQDSPRWLWLLLLLVAAVLMSWFVVAMYVVVAEVNAVTDAAPAVQVYGPPWTGQHLLSTSMAAAVAFALVPVTSVALFIHDYVLVGRATRLPRSSAGGSPAELEDGLRLGVGDPGLQLLFRAPDGVGLLDVGGRVVPAPAVPPSRLQELTVSDASLGVLVWSSDSRPDPARLSVLIGVVAVPLARARMQLGVLSRVIDLTDSRRRMLEAETAARRQIERDLHDGAQQRLTVSLMLLRNSPAASDPEEVTRRASEQVEAALREIQSLARGLHSATLASSGLAVAVEELAESLPLPVDVRVAKLRFPQLVEVTAYLVIKECLTNVVKYAEATRVSVAAEVASGAVLLRVEDDGCGGADPDGGTGLVGLSDRVGALDGSVRVDSPVGGGTRVDVVIPLADASAPQPLGT
jgi:signal transduction histidine kinase